MRRRVVPAFGFLVTIHGRPARELGPSGVLYLGGRYATVYRLKKHARRAITRTLEYAAAENIEAWKPENYHVRPLRWQPAQRPARSRPARRAPEKGKP